MSQAKHILKGFFSQSGLLAILISVKYTQCKGKEKGTPKKDLISCMPINVVLQLGSLSPDTTEIKVVLYWNEFGLTDLNKIF